MGAARRLRWGAIAILGVLAAAACSGGADSGGRDDVAVAAATGAAAPAQEGDEAADGGVGGDTTGDDVVAAATEAAAEEPGQAPLPDPGFAATGERIIKEGTVTITVEPGAFDRAFQAVIQRAQALGGHVVASASSTDAEGLVTGTVTVRVPVAVYEDLLTGLGDVGAVTDRSVSSQDVTAQYVDLESRLRHLRAQEAFYLDLLGRAAGVPDAIAVQQQLDGIQGQIEQITGQRNLLEDRTTFSTLAVELVEQGADASVLEGDEPEREGLARYWDVARETLVGVVGTLLVVLLFLAPFLAIAVVGWFGWRAVRPRRRATLTARAEPPDREPHAAHDTADMG